MDDFYNRSNYLEVITLQEAKDWLRIRVAVTSDDTIITGLITAASQFGEKYTGRIFKEVSFEGFFSCLSSTKYDQNFIEIRRSPLSAVSAVEVILDTDYEPFTAFNVKLQSSFSRLIFTESVNLSDTQPYPIKVTFTAGFTDCPVSIKQGMLSHIAFLYENRGDTAPENNLKVPQEVKSLYNYFRILNTYG